MVYNILCRKAVLSKNGQLIFHTLRFIQGSDSNTILIKMEWVFPQVLN